MNHQDITAGAESLTAEEQIWWDGLEARFSGMDEAEQAAWMETAEGRAYAAVMNGSWRENWDTAIKTAFQKNHGAEPAKPVTNWA